MAHSQGIPTPPSRVWLLSIPRSGSHLLTRIFSKQSKLSYSGYNFMDYIFQHHKIMDQNVTLDQLSTKDRDALLKTAKDGLAKTKSAIDNVEAEVKHRTIPIENPRHPLLTSNSRAKSPSSKNTSSPSQTPSSPSSPTPQHPTTLPGKPSSPPPPPPPP